MANSKIKKHKFILYKYKKLKQLPKQKKITT